MVMTRPDTKELHRNPAIINVSISTTAPEPPATKHHWSTSRIYSMNQIHSCMQSPLISKHANGVHDWTIWFGLNWIQHTIPTVALKTLSEILSGKISSLQHYPIACLLWKCRLTVDFETWQHWRLCSFKSEGLSSSVRGGLCAHGSESFCYGPNCSCCPNCSVNGINSASGDYNLLRSQVVQQKTAQAIVQRLQIQIPLMPQSSMTESPRDQNCLCSLGGRNGILSLLWQSQWH